MGAAFLVTCQTQVAEEARLFFTSLHRRNLFQAAAAFIVVIIHGEHKGAALGAGSCVRGFRRCFASPP